MALKKKVTWKWIFPGCFSSQKPALPERRPLDPLNSPQSFRRISVSDLSDPGSQLSINDLSNSVIGSNLYSFTLSELKSITRNFSSSNVLGEGGFGPVYKGFIDDKLRHGLKPQSVAVKVLDLDGSQGHREWLAEVIFLGQLRHPNLVKLIGYCCEDEQRVLVYEYLARGNLENHLFRKYSIAMPWSTRIKIALGAAKGLSFLHEEEKPVIYRDFKASNILLDSDFTAKLSDFGLAKDGPAGDDTHVTTRVMGTHGYAAPEYVTTGHLTMMSDVYSFGVVLLELLTGRRSMDKKRPSKEQSLVDWASPLLRDPRKLDRLMDPRLEGQYSIEGANRAAALAHRCLAQRPKSRPTMNVVVKALEHIMELKDDIVAAPFVYVVSTNAKDRKNDFEKDQTKKGDIEAEEEEKKVKVKEDVNHLGRKKVQRNRNKNERKHSRSRAIHSDTALYRTPLTGVNPTKYQRRRP